MVGMIYCQSGGGKTVNSCRINTRGRGRNLILNSDYSSVVLENFAGLKEHTDIEYVQHWLDKGLDGRPQRCFIDQFHEAVESRKYDTIVIDNVSDIFQMAIDELNQFPKHDGRQDYQRVYMALKRLVREANQVDCDVLFTAWEDVVEVSKADGELVQRAQPKIQAKILDNVCGLCQVVGRVSHTDDGRYYYDYRGSLNQYGKDQLFLRKTGLPENILDGGDRKDGN